MNNIINKVRTCFNKAYLTYDKQSEVQYAIGLQLIAALKNIEFNFNQALDLGCATGQLTEKLLQVLNVQHLIATDIAELCLQKAQERLGLHKVSYIQTDFHALCFQKPFDLIFANMSLQWSLNLEQTLKELYALLSPQGILAFSLPVQKTFSELPEQLHNTFHTAKDCETYLKKLPLKTQIHWQEKKIVPYPDFRTALKSIKKSGANCKIDQSVSLLSRALLKSDQSFSLTYDIACFVLQKEKS